MHLPSFYRTARCEQLIGLAFFCTVLVGHVRLDYFPGLGVIATLPDGEQELVRTADDLAPHVHDHLAREYNARP